MKNLISCIFVLWVFTVSSSNGKDPDKKFDDCEAYIGVITLLEWGITSEAENLDLAWEKMAVSKLDRLVNSELNHGSADVRKLHENLHFIANTSLNGNVDFDKLSEVLGLKNKKYSELSELEKAGAFSRFLNQGRELLQREFLQSLSKRN
jgi:hypothetical protein